MYLLFSENFSVLSSPVLTEQQNRSVDIYSLTHLTHHSVRACLKHKSKMQDCIANPLGFSVFFQKFSTSFSIHGFLASHFLVSWSGKMKCFAIYPAFFSDCKLPIILCFFRFTFFIVSFYTTFKFKNNFPSLGRG